MHPHDPRPIPNEASAMPLHAHTMLEFLGDTTYREYWRRIRFGLSQPRESGDHRYAVQQVLRVWAPITGIALPTLLALAVIMAPNRPEPAVDAITTITRFTPTPVDALDPTPPDVSPGPSMPPPPLDLPRDASSLPGGADLPGEPDAGPGDALTTAPDVAVAFGSAPDAFSDVARIRSPIVVSGGFPSRSSAGRQEALARYAGPGSVGATATEQAVYRALRWLKTVQEADGSWSTSSGGGDGQYGGARPAMTGLALLCFLAHGETPDSDEFGSTVERGLKWLIANQTADGGFKHSDENAYSQPIATYALCEAFALTRIPMLKPAAEAGIARIVASQNPPGGLLWNYKLTPSASQGAAATRNDLSISAWCMQALKAATIAGLEVPGLDVAVRRAAEGTRLSAVAAADGTTGFEYARQGAAAGGQNNITTAATLCLQLLGEEKSREVTRALQWLKRATCVWSDPWTDNPLYHWYYVTQVKFHAGGKTWTDWEQAFAPQLVRSQVIERSAIADDRGEFVEVGCWKPAGDPAVPATEHCRSDVYNTTLCTLMLEVYYRHLPTFQTPHSAERRPQPATPASELNISVL